MVQNHLLRLLKNYQSLKGHTQFGFGGCSFAICQVFQILSHSYQVLKLCSIPIPQSSNSLHLACLHILAVVSGFSYRKDQGEQ